jgi:hypothetical protein
MVEGKRTRHLTTRILRSQEILLRPSRLTTRRSTVGYNTTVIYTLVMGPVALRL